MRFLLGMLCVPFAFAAITSHAAEVQAGFYSGRAFRKLHIDRDHVAVHVRQGVQSNHTPPLSQRAESAFDMMGAAIVPRNGVRDKRDLIGYPVWFDKSLDAVGILTHEIVVRLEPRGHIDLIKKQPGFADLKRARFGADIFLAKFSSPMAALEAANALYRIKGVFYAHPNFMIPKNWRKQANDRATALAAQDIAPTTPVAEAPTSDPSSIKQDMLATFAEQMTSPAASATSALMAEADVTDPTLIPPSGGVTVPAGTGGPSQEPYFAQQWHLENTGQFGGAPGADIHAKAAWEITQGSEEVLIAVLDGGVQINHPDLEPGIWRNPGEIPANGRDDDGNGFVDDVNGWNFWKQSGDVSVGPADDHGTAVTGLVGARANGRGVTGSCPNCKLLPIVVAWEVADDAAAFYYASKAGAWITSNSWGYAVGTPATDVVSDAIRETSARGRAGKGMITLFAMNNIDQDDCSGSHPDISSLASVVAVSGADDTDKKVSIAAWGSCMEILSPTFDLNRPGIVTTDLVGQRGYNNGRRPGDLRDIDYTNDFGGTSAATPIAAGVFGLMLTVNPDLTRDDAVELVLRHADKIQPELANYAPDTGFSNRYGYGRINAGRAVSAANKLKRYSRSTSPRAIGLRR